MVIGPSKWRGVADAVKKLKCNVGRTRRLVVLKVLRCVGNRAVIEVDRTDYDLKSNVLRRKGLSGTVGMTAVNISASFMDAAARAGVRRAHCSGLFMSFTRLLGIIHVVCSPGPPGFFTRLVQDPVTMTMGLRYLVLLWRVLKQVTMRVPTSRTFVTVCSAGGGGGGAGGGGGRGGGGGDEGDGGDSPRDGGGEC